VSDRSTVKQIDYAKELKDLQKCKTYEKVKKVSKIKLPSVQGKQRYMVNDKQKLDDCAFDDLPDEFEVYPVIVKSDGDCLPFCGSVYLYGNANQTDETRLRIIHELCTNDELYLSNEHLSKGNDSNKTEENLAKPLTCILISMYQVFHCQKIGLGKFLRQR